LLAAGIILIWLLIIRMGALWKNEGIIHLYLLVNIIDAPANGKKYFLSPRDPIFGVLLKEPKMSSFWPVPEQTTPV
jgi:hypothetical protein